MLLTHFVVVTVLSSAPSQSPASAGTSTAAAETTARDLSPLLAELRTAHDVPGMTAAVTTGSRVVAIGAAGVRKRGATAPITVDDHMHLGSCTKSMTATLCAKLVEQGKLAWTNTASEAFAKLVPAIDGGWTPATLEHFVTNRSGTPTDLDPLGLWLDLRLSKGTLRAQRMQLVEGVLKTPPAQVPGTKFVYSNAGFAIAGAMAEVALDAPYETLLATHVFEPLGIARFGFGPPGTKGELDQPLGHGADGKPVEIGMRADNPAAITPAGRVHMPIGEWAKYVAAHVRGEREGGLVSKETFVKLHTPLGEGDERYAMGWAVTERPWGGRVLTHAGTNTMWFCVAWLAPERDFAVLVATNQGGDRAAKACDEAASKLIADYLAHEGATTK